MKPSELREMSIEELKHKEKELRKELFNLRFQEVTGDIQNPSRIKMVKKDIARVLTIITEKERKFKEN